MNTYVYQNVLTREQLKVESVEGVVRLTGDMNCSLLKLLAEATANRITGVQRVESSIRVRSGQEYPQDERIASRLKNLLKLFELQLGSRIAVDTSNGMVSLRGVVSSAEKAQRISRLMMGLEEVSGVQNYLTVDSTLRMEAVEVDDASVEAQSWTVLQQYRLMRSLPIKLVSNAGMIHMTGSVSNPAIKDLVAVHLQYINGVSAISNELSLAPSNGIGGGQVPSPPRNLRILAQ